MAAKPGPLRPHELRQDYSRKPPAEPPPGDPELGHSFLIVTEGEVTERCYFELVKSALRLNTVQVEHPPCTDAMGLVKAAIALYKRDSEGNRVPTRRLGICDVRVIDHVWVLFDTDIPHQQGQLAPALA